MEASPNISRTSANIEVGGTRAEPLIEDLVSEENAKLYAGYELPNYQDISGQPTVTYGEGKQQSDYGVTYIDRVEMNDEAGTSYDVMRSMSDNPLSDVWIVKDTAWGTQVNGLNTDVARKLMQIGFNVLVKGPEIHSSIPLSQSAYNTHVILDMYESLGYLNAKEFAGEGYSRGSMLLFGTNAYADHFDRKVLYSNMTDPCVALPVRVKNMDSATAKKAIALPMDIGMLGIAVAKGLVHPTRGKHMMKSVDLSLDGAKQFYRTGKPLMNGEAGMMATNTPKDMQATIAFFRRCQANDEPVYREILGDSRPGVRFVSPEGGHGGGIDKRIIGNIAVRFGRLAEELIEKGGSAEIDYRYITHGLKSA